MNVIAPVDYLSLNNASTWPLTGAELHFRVGFHPKKLLESRMSQNHTMFPSKPGKNADDEFHTSLRIIQAKYSSGINPGRKKMDDSKKEGH